MAQPVAGPASPSVAWLLPDPTATAQFGQSLARSLPRVGAGPLVFHFEGDLGAGKTSLIRGVLAGLGHAGRVPSPTYTLVEPYVLNGYRVLHVDLYRLRDPAELDDLGLADDLAGRDEQGRVSLLLAEWPSRGADRIPPADLHVHLTMAGEGRKVTLTSCTGAGAGLLREVRRDVPGGF